MENDKSLDELWDEAFADVDEGDGDNGAEETNSEVEEQETHTDGDETDPNAEENDSDGQPGGKVSAPDADAPILSEQDLAEINAELGTNYRSSSEFQQARRYIELRENGKFTAREALAAVGATAVNKSGGTAGSGKAHITASHSRRSNGEVMTAADRDELSKWGFKTQGKELESLWRRARG